MPYTEIDGQSIFYTISRGPADGPTLVLIHGAGGSRLHWPGELRRLPDATAYTLDLPGHGRSAGPGRDTIQGYAEAVVAFLDADDVAVERAIFAGHSMGGAIAQTLGLAFPDRTAGLVLVGTGARLRVAPTILEGIQADFEGAIDLITRYAWAQETSKRTTELGREALRETGPDVLFGDFVACDRFNVMDRLDKLNVPTLIVTGTADQLTPPKYAHFLAEHIPQANLTLIDGAGHMVMLERPAETVEAVQGFLGSGL